MSGHVWLSFHKFFPLVLNVQLCTFHHRIKLLQNDGLIFFLFYIALLELNVLNINPRLIVLIRLTEDTDGYDANCRRLRRFCRLLARISSNVFYDVSQFKLSKIDIIFNY